SGLYETGFFTTSCLPRMVWSAAPAGRGTVTAKASTSATRIVKLGNMSEPSSQFVVGTFGSRAVPQTGRASKHACDTAGDIAALTAKKKPGRSGLALPGGSGAADLTVGR